MNTKTIGNIGEAKVLAKFVELGYAVYLPFGDNEKADLIVEFNGKLNKIQIKATNNTLDGYYVIDFRNCTNHKTNRNPNQLYHADEIDYFATYCVERDSICLFDIRQMPNTAIRLRYEPTKNGQTSGIKWEKDYLIDTVLTNIEKENS